MSNQPMRRMMIRLSAQQDAALTAAAELRGTPKATVARSILLEGLRGTRQPPPSVPAVSAHAEPAPLQRPPWLADGRVGEDARSWKAWAWQAGEALRGRYPELADGNSGLPDTWPADRFFRDGLLALAVWRYHLDHGAYDDPRMELAFSRALLDFCAWVRERKAYAAIPGQDAPAPREAPTGVADSGGERPSRMNHTSLRQARGSRLGGTPDTGCLRAGILASLRTTRHAGRMARADLLVHLVRSAHEGDDDALRRTTESLIAEEREKQHHLLAERLEEAMHRQPSVYALPSAMNGTPATTGFSIVTPRRRLDELVLPESLRQAVDELVEEQQRSEVLRAHGLEPRHRVLLLGPPGNGKTSLAEAIAEALLLPLIVVRYEEVIGSYLGETASRLAAVFNAARSRRCVLFFDEFDALGKERGDEHETGEIKRVVSSLLLQVDAVPSHAIVVAASNHPELLDRAVHRRFELRLELPPPGKVARVLWFERLLSEFDEPTGLSADALARKTAGASFSQLQDLADDVRRRHVLAPGASLRRLLPERLARWREVSALEVHA